MAEKKPAQPQTPPVNTPPAKPQWDCQIAGNPKDGKAYTVGEVFTLGCKGAPLSLKPPLSIKLPEAQQYTLVLLKPIAVTETEVSYQATGYRAGQFRAPFLDIVDADGNGFITQSMEWKVGSVLDPQNPQQKGFGPMKPMPMAWPTWLPFAVVVVFMVLVAWILVFFRRRVQRKNLERNIRKYQSPMGSYHQYSKDIRLLKRGVLFSPRAQWTEPQIQAYLQKQEEHFRMFILREYVVPADQWSVGNILKHMRKKDRLAYQVYSPSVIKAFKELSRARGAQASLTAMDLEQISAICSAAIDAMWKSRKVGAR